MALSGNINSLTRYPSGSLRELWAIAWPLMLSGLSGSLMVFTDRAILAHYHSDAFNACVTVQPWVWTCELGLMAIVGCSEVIVGRLNGAKQFQRIGSAVWEVMMLAFSSYLLLIPVMLFAPYLLLSTVGPEGIRYMRMLLMTMPFELAGFGAIVSFFVGRCDTKKIPVIFIGGNLLNATLDYWFVFGGLGIPSLGITGAGLGTNISHLVCFGSFLTLFLRKKHREKYGIGKLQWSWDVIHQCFKIGLPNALVVVCNTAGWACVYLCFANYLSPAYYKAFCAVSTFYTFSFFVLDGNSKSVCTLCANLIGSGYAERMGTIIKQGVRLISIWAVIFGVFLYFSNPIVQFLSSNEFVSDAAFNKQASLFMIGYWLMFCTEGSFMCTTGFLFALFKVKWILTINLILYIGMVLVPVYFAVAIHHWNPIIYPALVVVKFCLILAGFYLWYRKKTWAQSVITQLKND